MMVSTYYDTRKRIRADELFDGRLAAFGVREEIKPGETTEKVRFLTDGDSRLKVTISDNGVADTSVRNPWSKPETKILHSIAEAFDTDLVSEHEPEYWGFDTQAEWDAYQRRIHEEHEQQFYAELLKHVGGEPNDIRPGTIGMIQAEIAKRPSLLSPENKQKLLSEIDAIYDRDHAVKVRLTPEQVVEADVVAIMRAATLPPRSSERDE
jgi:hypothetical protein